MKAPLLLCCLLPLAATARTAPERITPDNVQRLAVAWTYDAHNPTGPTHPAGKPPAFEATPVYASGRLYVSTPLGTVAALDAETGAEVWRVELDVRRNTRYSDPANRGPTLKGDRLYVGTIDARLVCLERRDGRRCPKFGLNGEVDLTKGLRHPPQWPGEYGVTSPPAVYRNLVIVGSSIADNSRAQMASGEVRAFDGTTGALRWTFHPLPADSAAGGGNTWSRIVVDERNGLAFLPTGSPSPDYYGGSRPGNNGYANSIVALKAATGDVVWHFQTVHHDLWDYDVASPPLLWDSRNGLGRNGLRQNAHSRDVPALAVGSKTGHVFLFNRLDGTPLFPIVERAVPGSDVPGEHSAATQPFPTKPASLVPQQLGENELWGATPADLEACRQLFHTLHNSGVFTPPSIEGSVHVPGNIGGLHWGGLAWDAQNRLLIAPVNRLPAIIRLIPRAQYDAARREFPKRETTEQDGAPYSMSREFFVGPSGAPCVAPPWGELVAIHADSGEVAWHVPLGDLREKFGGARAGDTPLASPNLGGPATTDTGLVFIGATLDDSFRAFDSRSGQELWKAKLPTSARATPLVFTTENGRHMVAIAAGGHDNSMSRIDTKLVVFALKGR
ncbi:MAG TPA: pyrroloquinoline quinone-dependent dehydrogenase [Steroidobacteraceae bacterium]|nr:pyrroloquinoline quinone-dependent dehydrogenase [Steroidobacteraceae bacterium]